MSELTRAAARIDRKGAQPTTGDAAPRDFVDQRGVLWHVVERDARRDPGARADRCLVFDCADVCRRVWRYPAHWRELSPDELVALSWSR